MENEISRSEPVGRAPAFPFRLKDAPVSERPRERCLERGAHCLSLRELLAILIHSGPPGIGALGLGSRLLERPGKGLGEGEQERALFTAFESSAGEAPFRDIRGLGPAARARLLAAFELGRRYALRREAKAGESPNAASGMRPFHRAAAKVSAERRQEPREWLGFVALHRTGELGELCLVELGVRTHVNVEPAELFTRLLALRPQGFFLFHNHPSGSRVASAEDRHLTLHVRDLAAALGLRLLGHALVTAAGETWIDMV